MKLEKRQRVNAGPSVGLRPSLRPSIDLLYDIEQIMQPVQTNESTGPVWVTRSPLKGGGGGGSRIPIK